MAARVLITGSRTWVHAAVIRDALLSVWGDGDAVLVSGACPRGANRIAYGASHTARLAEEAGIPTTRYRDHRPHQLTY
jgi:hypothetical protein